LTVQWVDDTGSSGTIKDPPCFSAATGHAHRTYASPLGAALLLGSPVLDLRESLAADRVQL